MNCASLQTTAVLQERASLSAENYRLRLACPSIAAAIRPGQIFMLRVPGRSDPLLGRPFALYDTVLDSSGTPVGIDVGIHVVGKLTGLLEQLPLNSELEIWGPLGNGFPAVEAEHLIQVAGGIGYTPFVAVSRAALAGKTYGTQSPADWKVSRASLIYGVRTRKFRADLSDWADLPGLSTHICTEDGSEGHHGLVTDLLRSQLQLTTGKTVVFTCGPLRMMQAVAAVCAERKIECWASLETPMACGFGACFSCVVPVQDATSETGWDYRRACVEGPVFRADQLQWEQLCPQLIPTLQN